MIKNFSQLEVLINEKTVRLQTDMDTDINIVRAACHQFLQFVDQVEAAAQQKPEIAKPEEVECLPL